MPITGHAGVDSRCAEWPPGPLIKTDAAGNYIKSYLASDAEALNCFVRYTDPYPSLGAGADFGRLGGVSGVPAKTSAKVGTNVAVNGSAAGPPRFCPINLQRLYGKTAWRTVNSAGVRVSGRYTLTATPAYRGKIPYRVELPACNQFVTSTSKPFTITGL